MNVIKACEDCIQNCVLLHGQKKNPSPVVLSFLKFLYGNYDYSKLLYLPPKVSRTMSFMGDQQNYDLEDSSGQRWTVTLSNINGALAFGKGWSKFFANHGLREGDTLLFNYIMGSHFIVHIYGRTGCQKLKFAGAKNIRQEKKSRTAGFFYAEDGECQRIFNDSTHKQGSNTSMISGSNNVSQSQPSTNGTISSLENGNSGLQLISRTDNELEQFYTIDRDPGYNYEDDRIHLHDLSNFEKPNTGVDATGANDDRFRPSDIMVKSQTFACITNDNPVTTELMSGELPAEVAAFATIGKPPTKVAPSPTIRKPPTEVTAFATIGEPTAEVAAFATIQEKNATSLGEKVSVIDKDHMGHKPSVLPLKRSAGRSAETRTNSATKSKKVKFREAEKRGKHSSKNIEVRIKEEMEINQMTSCEIMCSARNSKVFNELERISTTAEKDNDQVLKVVKTEPRYSINKYPSNASNCSCLAVVERQAMLELPDCLPSNSFRAKLERKLIYLRGPDTRLWPALYHQKYGLKALASGWESFCKANGIQPGDKCTFEVENESEGIYKVDVVGKL